MFHPRIPHRVIHRPPAWLVGGFVLLAVCVARPAGAVIPRPWVPPAADSLIAWTAEAKARFQLIKGDSASGPNQAPYDLVGRIGRRLIRTIGKENVSQVGVVETVLDSLGLDTDLVTDPALPNFILLMVRNPYRPGSEAAGYLYWYMDDELRMQGVLFRGGYQPRMRVWWSGQPDAPYEWGILDQQRDPEGYLGLVLLRMLPNGRFWNIVQYAPQNSDLGHAGDAFWIDINRDGIPEIVSWVRANVDSSFEECPGCPHLVTERMFTLRANGFELEDSRLLPTPYSTFVLFIRMLREKNESGARRLLADPAKLENALALGWGKSASGHEWKLEYVEEDQPWPHWLAMRFNAGPGKPIYIVHFVFKDARWIIEDWIVPRGRGGKGVTPGATGP
jgi:hypothetical protein